MSLTITLPTPKKTVTARYIRRLKALEGRVLEVQICTRDMQIADMV